MNAATVTALATAIVSIVTAVSTGIALIIHARNANAHQGATSVPGHGSVTTPGTAPPPVS